MRGIALNRLDAEGNGLLRIAFERAQSSELLRTLPVVDTEKYHIDQDHTKWASSTGLVTLFSKRYPGATARAIDAALRDIDESIEWIPARTITSRPGAQYTSYRTLRMYKVAQDSLRAIDEVLKEHLDHLVDN